MYKSESYVEKAADGSWSRHLIPPISIVSHFLIVLNEIIVLLIDLSLLYADYDASLLHVLSLISTHD